MNTENYLDMEIKRLYERMTELDPETKEYEDVEEKYLKMVAQKLEIEKHEASVTQTEKQMKMDRVDRAWRVIVDSGKVVLPLGTAVVMTLLAYTFEAKGVIPMGVGKKWADKLTKF